MKLLSLFSILSAVLIIAFVLSLWVVARETLAPSRVPGLGNFAGTVDALPPPGDSFRFAVLGDPEGGLGVYRRLMERAAAMGAAFTVIAGDVMAKPTREAFELFEYEYARLGPSALPTFACAGNHDIRKSGDLSLFQEYLGPEVFSFVYGGSLFILLDNNSPSPSAGCAQRIRDILAGQDSEPEHVFVVMHRPIIDYGKRGKTFPRREESRPIFDLVEEGKIDVVLTGHAHSYARQTIGQGLTLVTGGAGGHLYNKDDFFHMVLIDVTPSGIKDTIVKVDDEGSGRLEKLHLSLFVSMYPRVFGHWYVPAALSAAAAMLLVLGCLGLRGIGRCERLDLASRDFAMPDGTPERQEHSA